MTSLYVLRVESMCNLCGTCPQVVSDVQYTPNYLW